jgi:GTPase SAR1 family protein
MLLISLFPFSFWLLVFRLVKEEAPSGPIKSTVAVDIHERTVKISPQTEVTLEIWDTAGQERYSHGR